jgi:hypothetical protein
MVIESLRTREGGLGCLYGIIDVLLARNLDFRNQLAGHRANEVDRLAGLGIDVLNDEKVRLGIGNDYRKSHAHLVVDEKAGLDGETGLKLCGHFDSERIDGWVGSEKVASIWR